jgi:hypothetical protein
MGERRLSMTYGMKNTTRQIILAIVAVIITAVALMIRR